MRTAKAAAALAALCLLLLPTTSAAKTWNLLFSGPQTAWFSISNVNGAPFVNGFSVYLGKDFADVPAPLVSGPLWTSTIPDTEANESALRLVSSVTLSPSGGTIQIYPGAEFEAGLDSGLDLTLDYTLSKPEPVGSDFADIPVSGGYTYFYSVDAMDYPGVGPDYFFQGSGSGTFSSLTATTGIPEPATWTMLLGGLFVLGGALRGRRAGRIGNSVGLAPMPAR